MTTATRQDAKWSRFLRFHEAKYRRARTPADKALVRFNQWRGLVAKFPPPVAADYQDRMSRILLGEINRITGGGD